MTCRAEKSPEVNWIRFEIACRTVLMARDGLINAMLTGTGEPVVFPQLITDYLEAMDGRFPLITLQTNGSLLTESLLKEWAEQGLTAVCISVAATSPHTSNRILGCPNPEYNYWDAVKMIHDAGLMARLNCTMLQAGVFAPHHVEELIDECLKQGVEQLTLREVDQPDNAADSEIKEYVDEQKPYGAAKKLSHYLEMHEAHLLHDLPHGGVVFDYRGQNICISNCLTDSPDPNDIRQIIFFPNGAIGYDWKYKGARIL
jgi:molybdenum cofactor biosynthesis enzyme MoaA